MAHATALPKSLELSIAMACIAGQTHGAAGYLGQAPGKHQTQGADCLTFYDLVLQPGKSASIRGGWVTGGGGFPSSIVNGPEFHRRVINLARRTNHSEALDNRPAFDFSLQRKHGMYFVVTETGREINFLTRGC